MKLRNAAQRHVPTLFRTAKRLYGRNFEMFPFRSVYALGRLHHEIKARFGTMRNGYFFEVGANDGLAQSNTAYLGRYLGWTGLLVEAIPHKYVECVANRPDAQVVHAALVPRDFEAEYLEVSFANLMSATALSDLEDVDRHIDDGERFLGSERKLARMKFLAPTRTVASVVEEAGNPAIDLFSLDVEGAELSVLHGVNFARNAPRNFVIETRDLTSVADFLSSNGYGDPIRLTHHDYLFERRD